MEVKERTAVKIFTRESLVALGYSIVIHNRITIAGPFGLRLGVLQFIKGHANMPVTSSSEILIDSSGHYLTVIDQKDLAILRELEIDSSRSTKAIAKTLSMPRATVHERIRKMREKGIIRGFTVIPDYSKLGEPISAFILVSFLPNSFVSQRELAKKISELEGVREVHLISGEYDILLKVRGKSMEDIGSLVIDRLRQIEGVGRTITCASFATVKDEP
jgi:DNA-binding Lrp family transcriptional regulator